MGRRTITVHHVRAVLAGARGSGIDTVPLLQAAQIPPLLLGDDRARVTPAQFARLFRALYRTTQDEFLGLSSVPSRPGTFAMMCYASLGCADLGAGIARAAAFYGLFPGGPELALEVEGAEARFTVRNDFARDEERFLTECVLAIWHRLSSWLIGRRIPLAYAEFAYPAPPHEEEYAVLFDCPVRFGAARTGAVFGAPWLEAPLVRDEAAVEAMLRRAPFDLLSRPEYGPATVADQVRRTLARRLRAFPALTEVAAQLALSPATLRRRLRAEGTSFQQLKDHVRRDAAIAGLAESGEPIAELAARLGFSEDTAFHRAFRRWTGTTPAAYRLSGAP
ncbi:MULTISPECIES: AraC family transcriptional regulator [unclassified Streptomyces]|nr:MULTISPECIES: AraC family transcriptional regulator [unclassified Streptomyces]MCX4527424.1 AraC family transcriptional regulator [Streptomyces sp. NBC_01551]MCX4541995.1 AraC family transcriptional regulator [Streptomyces sp. NBC_01565]